jgi:hypothetical protein
MFIWGRRWMRLVRKLALQAVEAAVPAFGLLAFLVQLPFSFRKDIAQAASLWTTLEGADSG